MGIPRRAERDIIHHLLVGILRAAHRDYFSDAPYMEAVEATLILAEIIVAQLDDGPTNATRLAEHLGVSRQTVARRLDTLQAKGAITIDAEGHQHDIRIDGAMLASPAGDRCLSGVVQLVLDAAKALTENLTPPSESKMDSPKMGTD